jgi:hypothetical protein
MKTVCISTFGLNPKREHTRKVSLMCIYQDMAVLTDPSSRSFLDLWRRYDMNDILLPKGADRQGFNAGSTNSPAYDGEYFADDQDVIVVSAK